LLLLPSDLLTEAGMIFAAGVNLLPPNTALLLLAL